MNQSDMLPSHSLSSSSDIDWGKYEAKKYLHFDQPTPLTKELKAKLLNPNWVIQHSFWPSIHFVIEFNKYVLKENYRELKLQGKSNKELREKKIKKRDIYYSSHVDSYIYKYYGDVLNNHYNKYANNCGIDESIIAYRNNKKGKNTIDFCYEVFEKLFGYEEAIIISIDFTKYFDNINHSVLKKNIQEVLDVSKLEKDLYTVFKNLTKFTYVKKEDVSRFLIGKYGTDNTKILRKEYNLKRIMTDEEFREFKKKYMYKHKKPYGIPQGSGMSAVCSNVHLIHFDQEIQRWVDGYGGLYRRYCDDIILIIPNKTTENWEEYRQQAFDIIKKYENIGLKIQPEKTVVRLYENRLIKDTEGNLSQLDYLGFVTNGNEIRIREKSLFKYYSRAYRKAKKCKKSELYFQKEGKTRLYGRRDLYRVYTHLGRNYKKRGNFITYSNKAHMKMKNLAHVREQEKYPIESNIYRQIKRHWAKIQKRLK